MPGFNIFREIRVKEIYERRVQGRWQKEEGGVLMANPSKPKVKSRVRKENIAKAMALFLCLLMLLGVIAPALSM